MKSADPQSHSHILTFQYRATENNIKVKITIATIETVGLAEGSIDDVRFV